jgi:hypothetical protein
MCNLLIELPTYYKICSYIIKNHITKIYGRIDVRRIAPSTGQRWPVSFKPGHVTPDDRARSPIGQRAGWTPQPVWTLLRRWKSLAHAANRASTSFHSAGIPVTTLTEPHRLKKHLYVYTDVKSVTGTTTDALMFGVASMTPWSLRTHVRL